MSHPKLYLKKLCGKNSFTLEIDDNFWNTAINLVINDSEHIISLNNNYHKILYKFLEHLAKENNLLTIKSKLINEDFCKINCKINFDTKDNKSKEISVTAFSNGKIILNGKQEVIESLLNEIILFNLKKQENKNDKKIKYKK